MTESNQKQFYNLSTTEQEERLHALMVSALPKFGFPDDSQLELIKYRENAIFSAVDSATGKKHAIRIHRPGYQARQTILSELQWMESLGSAGVYTPKLLTGVDGNKVQTVSVEGVPEIRYCSAMEWIEGQPMDEEASPEDYRLVGKISARIHQHARNWTLPQEFTRQSWDENGMFKDPLWGNYKNLEALNKDQLELMDQAKKLVLDRLEKYGKASDRFGLIHADLMPENVLIHEGTPYVIDFDDSGFGWFMYDLATLLAINIPDEEQALIAKNAWVEGYRSVQSLPDTILNELPTFIMCRYLVGLGWLHTRKETPLALEYTDAIIEMACTHAKELIQNNK